MSARERAELDNQRKERRPVDPMNNLIAELIRRGRYMIKRLVGDMPPVVPFRLCEIEHGPKPDHPHRALYVVDPSSNETTSAALARSQTIPFSTQSTRLTGIK